MKIRFLGDGSAFCPERKNTSAYFFYDRKLFVLDCGETVFETMYNLHLIQEAPEIYTIITHLHADHVGSLPTLISYYGCILHKRVNIVSRDPKLVDLLDLMGIDHSFYAINYPEEIPARGIRLTAVPVQHADDIYCCGYLVETDEETFYYSGDAADIPENILKKFLNGEIAKIYQDTCSSPNEHHCYVGKLTERIPADKRDKVYCMHLDRSDIEYCRKYGFQTA